MNDCPITFMWLQLPSSFGSDNQLYIRMNSRGKQLTDFENFKAELYEKILNDDKCKKEKDFKSKIDGDWYSMLWEYAVIKVEDKVKDKTNDIEEKARLIDVLMKRIIHWTIVSKAAESAKSDGEEVLKSKQSKKKPRTENELRKRDRQDLFYQYCQPTHEQIDILRCDVDQYRTLIGETNSVFSKTFLCDLSNLLDFLLTIKKEGVFQFIVNDILSITQGKKSVTFMIDSYAPRILLYAITRFANEKVAQQDKIAQQDEIACFKSFYRIILNLVSTTEIDSPSDFQKAVAVISNWNGNTENWLNKTVFKGAFREAQVKEEKIKWSLISKCDWKKEILAAENTDFCQCYKPRDYFRGQIGFLLHMAGVNEGNLKNLNQDQLNDFKYYSKAVREIFDERKYWEKKDDAKKEDPDKLTGKCDTYINLLQAADCKKYSFDNLFHRAMLAHTMLAHKNYWVNAPGNNIKTFFVYNESHNNYDWRGAFRQKDDKDKTWGTAVGCLKDLLDNYKPKNPDKYSQEYKFDFDDFKDYLVDRIEKWLAGQIGNSNVNEKAEERLRALLIREPNCFKYIRNNYYVYWNDEPPEYLLMRLKLKRDGSFINITDQLTKQGHPQ